MLVSVKMSLGLVLFSVLLASSAKGTVAADSVLFGIREPCMNEGEEVKIDMACFKCICKNGFVECEQESCPAVDDCYFYNKKTPGKCCDRCIGCLHEGRMIDSGTEWTDPGDPCDHYKCVSGVITRSRIKCYAPCSNPLTLKHGQCCPVCLGCQLNGQQVTGEATLSEDPCVKCTCDGRKLTCMKKSCPVLQCPASKQIRLPGECCARCKERREEVKRNLQTHCIIGKAVHLNGKTYSADQCATCECRNGTSYCEKNTCPLLECAVDDQVQGLADCCPSCPTQAEFKSTCSVSGKVYQNGETWSLSACASCECRSGEVRCAKIQCPKPKCKPNETLITPKEQCCPKCVESPGVCTVFGDPHYKTFDGNFFSFQGSCKYQLTADCKEHSFSIRVTNDARLTKSSSWTKTVTLKLGNVKVNLGQKMRVKVNGTRIDPPYQLGNVLDIYKNDEGTEVVVATELGIKLTWDGSNFIQVEVPTIYKNKLCGLCGNYNSIFRDDLVSRNSINMTDNVWKFAQSWSVGGEKACTRPRKKELAAKNAQCKTKKFFTFCKIIKTDVFGNCNSQLNPEHYFESCKFDMCECPHKQCYCDSLAAYAHECQRQGIRLPNWRRETNCYPNATNSLISPHHHLLMQQQPPLRGGKQQQQHHHQQQNKNAIIRPNQRHRKKQRRPKLMPDSGSRKAPPPLFS
ncbi:BMP-binding endothelial regulator protein [Topomyia yanbarensis]|uniref:BMP-binding endothelial regulator protein n=1 Tax=Topomyia yanbarensis TaxID=2498891 RepID=UPI00273BCCD7|nr:BMP-binding endothelial regulator protein [Topomyia yanbarensis]XP_058836842.1 BMP-binding endothelial regulator protein [Topomyia yanbarensis]